MQKLLTDFFCKSCTMSMSSLNIENICELTGESEHFSVPSVDEVTVFNNGKTLHLPVSFIH